MRNVAVGLFLALLACVASAQAQISPSTKTAADVLAQLKRGHLDAAIIDASQITSTEAVVQLRADKRFDPVLEGRREQFDPVRAANNEADMYRRQMIESPKLLWPVARLARTLNFLGRQSEAVKLVDDALRRGLNTYTDGPVATRALLSYRAEALLVLGLQDEALATFRLASGQPEAQGRNTSDVLNYASVLTQLGRYEEALHELRRVGLKSDFGTAVEGYIRVCAESAMGHEEAAAKALARLQRMKSEFRDPLQKAYLCLNREDDGAKLLIARVEDPDERLLTLWSLQDRREAKSLTPVIDERWRRLLARPDVRAAVDSVGRIEKVDLY